MLDFSAYIAERTHAFTGREWVFRRIDNWLSGTGTPRVFLITGASGVGKTALAARLVEMSQGLVAADDYPNLGPGRLAFFHFCQEFSDPSLSTGRFTESLARNLANAYPVFRDALINHSAASQVTINATQQVGAAGAGSQVKNVVIESLHIGNLAGREAFDLLVRRPLEALCTPDFREMIVLLVDAIDEAQTYNAEENIAALLQNTVQQLDNLPAQVRFMFTCPPGLPDFSTVAAERLDLLDDVPTGLDEVFAYALARLADVQVEEERRQQLARRLATQAQGNFLYARYMLDDANRLSQMGEEVPLPSKLEDIYREFLERHIAKDRQMWARVNQRVLSLLTVARGQGLTQAQLTDITKRWSNDSVSSYDVSQFLQSCNPYLSRSGDAEQPIHLYHPSFRAYLLSENAGRFQVDREEANRAVVDFYLEEYRDRWGECDEDYPLLHLPAHVMQAISSAKRNTARRQLRQDLVSLLANWDFLQAKVGRIGVDESLRDLRAAHGLFDQANEQSPLMSMWLQTLDREAPPFRSRQHAPLPNHFAQHVHKRATMLGLTELATEAASRLAATGRPHFLLNWQSGPQSSDLLRTLSGHAGWVNAVTIVPSGDYAVSASHDGTVRVWAIETGEQVRKLTGHGARVKALTAVDARHVLAATSQGALILWNLETGEQEAVLSDHTASVGSVAVTTDGQHAVSGGFDRTVRVWDLLTGQVERVFEVQSGQVQGVAISPNGSCVLAACSNRTVLVWDRATGVLLHTLAGHRRGVTALALTPDGQKLLSGARSGEMILWNLGEGRQIWKTTGDGAWVESVAVTPDGRFGLSATRDRSLTLWDLADGQELSVFRGHGHWVLGVAVRPNGRQIVSASRDRTLKVWELASDPQSTETRAHTDRVRAVAFTPDGRHGLSGSEDCTLKLWDLASGRVERTYVGHAQAINAVAVTPDGERAVSASEDATLKVWDLARGDAELSTLSGHRSEVRAVAFLPEGHQALSAAYDRTLRLWDLETQQMVREFGGHRGGVRDLAITPDGNQAVSGSFDRVLLIWDLTNGQVVGRLEGHSDQINTLVLTQDGTRCVSASADGVIKVWELATGRTLYELDKPSQGERDLVITQDGNYLITASGDGWLKLRRLHDLALVSELALEEIPLGLAIDDARLLVGDRAGNVYYFRYALS